MRIIGQDSAINIIINLGLKYITRKDIKYKCSKRISS